MKPFILVIGVGNEFRGDDAIGLLAARELNTLQLPGVQVMESRGDGARLMRLWQGAAKLILIDAVRTGAPPGTLHRLDAGHHPIPSEFQCSSSHQFGVVHAIETARALGDLPADTVIFGIEVDSCIPGTPSALYEHVRETLLRALRAELAAADLVHMASHR